MPRGERSRVEDRLRPGTAKTPLSSEGTGPAGPCPVGIPSLPADWLSAGEGNGPSVLIVVQSALLHK